MELKEKINYLSNNLAVTEQYLYDAVLLEYPQAMDIDLYLSLQAVMISVTRESPKVILSFLQTVLKQIDISLGLENTIYRIYYIFKHLPNNKRIGYVAETFGRYHVSKAVTLLEHIGEIEKLKYKLV